MRGYVNGQAMMFSYLSPEARVSASHPLRPIKAMAEQVLQRLSPTFEAMYSQTGRPSIPPERLLKGELLLALFSIRGYRLFCEMLEYNILFRWFLDLSLDEPVFDHSTFSQNSERLLTHERLDSSSIPSCAMPRARGCCRMSTSPWTGQREPTKVGSLACAHQAPSEHFRFLSIHSLRSHSQDGEVLCKGNRH